MAESSSSGALDGSFSIIGAHPVQEPEAYESDVFHTTMLAAIQEYWARTRDASSVPSKWRGNITGSAYALYLKKGCLLAKEEWRKYCIRKGLTDTTWGIWHQGNFNFEEITAAIREASPGSSKTAKGKTTKVNLENLESALQSSMRCTKDNIFPALPPRRGPPLENFITVAKEMEKKFDEIFANHILARMLMLGFAIVEYRFRIGDGFGRYGE
ncbi:hypothetical protein QFC22_005644 [Naganishia vaughanmartiniae]|uniref:Uncharacterized protein n=1 Tax=Naganishia vaughanmartiniae TaxID=1424756 RepID=A0ACC2WTL4_9TREE|nr:hypothetical protein QFC22_005644 [Naganishia vaughanmartiniae]